MNIDYSKECLVLFVFLDDKDEYVTMHYRRPQIVDDLTINMEAENNAKDIIKKKTNGAKELIAIGVARNKQQQDDMEKQLSGKQ